MSQQMFFPSSARCDICTFRDGRHELAMIQCQTCELYVHKECCGMETYRKRKFVCWACQSVGKSFQIEAYDESNRRVSLIQKERPVRCGLCGVQNGIHSMHPLYDDPGPTGRQMFQDTGLGERRLVWAHTLCSFLLSTQGLLYGCLRDGSYDQIGNINSVDGDGRSVNPELADITQETDADYGTESAPIHHFVYYTPKKDGTLDDWCKAVQNLKKNLRCTICGRNDKPETVLRIPIQCFANNKEEYKDFRHRHPSLGDDEFCTMAMHVGCARWGSGNPKQVKRVYYYPGGRSKHDQPIIGVYCTLHGEDLDPKVRQTREEEESLRLAERRSSRAAAMARRVGKTSAIDTSVLPSLAKIKPKKRRRTSSTASEHKKVSAITGVEPVTDPSKDDRRRRKKLYENLDKDLASAVSERERPKLAKQRKVLAKQMSHVTDSQLKRIEKEVAEKVMAKRSQAERKQVILEQKRYWKRELSELATGDFKILWQKVIDHLAKLVLKRHKQQKLQGADSSNPIVLDLSDDEDINQKDAESMRNIEKSRASASTNAVRVPKNNHKDHHSQDKVSETVTENDAPSEPDDSGPVDLGDNDDHNGNDTEVVLEDPKEAANRLASEPDDGGPVDLGDNDDHKGYDSEVVLEDPTEAPNHWASEPDDSGPVDLGDNDDHNENDTEIVLEDPKEAPNRWAYLALSPCHKSEQYGFGEWEYIKEL